MPWDRRNDSGSWELQWDRWHDGRRCGIAVGEAPKFLLFFLYALVSLTLLSFQGPVKLHMLCMHTVHGVNLEYWASDS
jgi:hypothetical protein